MKVEDITTLQDAERFIEGCVNDLSDGLSTKGETMGRLGEYTGRLMELFWENAKKKIRENPELLNEKQELINVNWLKL